VRGEFGEAGLALAAIECWSFRAQVPTFGVQAGGYLLEMQVQVLLKLRESEYYRILAEFFYLIAGLEELP
jgi:hypothetical protein